MTKHEIRDTYRRDHEISYDHAVLLLMRLGFTEYAADKFLFAEDYN